ncbi:TetR/AcrR family transcriptional regulator [Sinorhizobium numidicum]|uniref:TetR/AcrR family transcriptional regulator n=1 Tax=Sinorhizobium numidicum TaxID=680248 RepID=A0ABY8CUH1_9HYPH|nr:TetR/AcrR family transcriptional regulator [Sinorhizobium numidicum]WEX74660.1 TetR/AcrR family transcriptional regulator [Sinorhizobium numidicum]WEX80651.1 TetR/AcrR family transcriptional regulator [Sinorhizobium numidicum]
MARTKEFDRDEALDAAIGVFREHGYEGSSTDMLVRAMKIGRQSLYDTFGDKWKLYCLAVERYSAGETNAHIGKLRGESRALDGIRAMMERVVEDAGQACLGVSSICEFGQTMPELAALHHAADWRLKDAARERIAEAQIAGDVDKTLSAGAVADFLFCSIAGMRIAARGGASREHLQSLGRLTLRAIM